MVRFICHLMQVIKYLRVKNHNNERGKNINMMLEIYAGEGAFKTIQEHGFKQELFTNFLGASGGPKWFILYALDKYFFGEFFKERTTPLNIIGSSIGAFRAACFSQKQPIQAIELLAKHYSETTYSDKPTPSEVSAKVNNLVEALFDNDASLEIINNPLFRAHFIVTKVHGLSAKKSQFLQAIGFLYNYLLNRLNRKYLDINNERYIFHHPQSSLDLTDQFQITTHKIPLNIRNIKQALLASASIPIVMERINNIAGSPIGTYRDGGIVDYHFDFMPKGEGLTLYPHFNSTPKAGWFDKNLNRSVSAKNYDKTVLICPSQKFINTLSQQKIPDRSDFKTMSSSHRIKFWKEVLDKTTILKDEFKHFLNSSDMSRIRKLNF